MLSMGLTRNFHGKKGGGGGGVGAKCFEVSRGWGPTQIFAINIFLHQAPLQVFVNGR